jgi:DNA-binding GntR family transcriptional regulator
MWDAVETRIIIDCEALRRSLARGDGAWEARLVAAFHALKHAREQRHDGPLDAAGAMQADNVLEMRHNAFHSGLIEACGSRSLLSLSAQFYAQTERYRRPSLRDPRYANLQRDVPTEHSQILEAALARDNWRALLARHYRETGRVIQQLLALDAPEAKRR